MTTSSSLSAEARARRIRLIIFDVDGVLTDGGIWLFPAPAPSTMTSDHAAQMAGKGGYAIASQTMVEAKGFNAHDGTGISLARLGGMKCAIITNASRRPWPCARATCASSTSTWASRTK